MRHLLPSSQSGAGRHPREFLSYRRSLFVGSAGDGAHQRGVWGRFRAANLPRVPERCSACKRDRTSTKTSRYDTEHGGYGSRADRAVTIADFVSHLQSLDVRLSAEGERLRLNAPQGVLTDSLRSQLAERKQELLQFLGKHKHSAAFIPPPILRRASSEPSPLSFAQERLWFLEQLDPNSTGYNLCRAWRLAGGLNVAALES